MYPSEALYRDLLAVYYAIIYDETKDPKTVREIQTVDPELVITNLERFKFTMNFYGVRNWDQDTVQRMLSTALADQTIVKLALKLVAGTLKDNQLMGND